MIRQAISCDICATEKKQTNHWFVAYEQAGELRLSGWSSRNRLRPGTKHLCGQTCLHKLVDDFMARAIAVRPRSAAADASDAQQQAVGTDASLTSDSAYVEAESSARLITPTTLPVPKFPFRNQTELVAIPGRLHAEQLLPLPGEPQRFATLNRRAEAWERERDREKRASENRPDIAARRRSTA